MRRTLFLVLFLVMSSGCKKPAAEGARAGSPHAIPANRQSEPMCGEFPTEQQMAAFETELRNRILPSFETNFPGPNMRSEIARLRTKVVSGEVLLDMIRTPLNGTHALAAGLPLRDGGILPVIYVSIPQLICANRLRGEDVMVAELAAYLVHEFSHAEHHLKA